MPRGTAYAARDLLPAIWRSLSELLLHRPSYLAPPFPQRQVDGILYEDTLAQAHGNASLVQDPVRGPHVREMVAAHAEHSQRGEDVDSRSRLGLVEQHLDSRSSFPLERKASVPCGSHLPPRSVAMPVKDLTQDLMHRVRLPDSMSPHCRHTANAVRSSRLMASAVVASSCLLASSPPYLYRVVYLLTLVSCACPMCIRHLSLPLHIVMLI